MNEHEKKPVRSYWENELQTILVFSLFIIKYPVPIICQMRPVIHSRAYISFPIRKNKTETTVSRKEDITLKKLYTAIIAITVISAASLTAFASEDYLPGERPLSMERSATPFSAQLPIEGTLSGTQATTFGLDTITETETNNTQYYQNMSDMMGQTRTDTGNQTSFAATDATNRLIVTESVERYNINDTTGNNRTILINNVSVPLANTTRDNTDTDNANNNDVNNSTNNANTTNDTNADNAINNTNPNNRTTTGNDSTNINPYARVNEDRVPLMDNPDTGMADMSVTLFAAFAALGAAPLVMLRKK